MFKAIKKLLLQQIRFAEQGTLWHLWLHSTKSKLCKCTTATSGFAAVQGPRQPRCRCVQCGGRDEHGSRKGKSWWRSASGPRPGRSGFDESEELGWWHSRCLEGPISCRPLHPPGVLLWYRPEITSLKTRRKKRNRHCRDNHSINTNLSDQPELQFW